MLHEGRSIVATGLERLARQVVFEGKTVDASQYNALLAIAAAQKALAQSAAAPERGRPVTTGARAERLLRSTSGAGHGGARQGSGRKPSDWYLKMKQDHHREYELSAEWSAKERNCKTATEIRSRQGSRQ